MLHGDTACHPREPRPAPEHQRKPRPVSSSPCRAPASLHEEGSQHEFYKTSPALSTSVLFPMYLGPNCLTLTMTVHSTLADGFQHLL